MDHPLPYRLPPPSAAPGAVAPPLSDAVLLPGGLAFISGQGPLVDGVLTLGTIEHEVDLTLRNLLAVVERLGGQAQHIVRCTCYLADLADVPAMNAVYARTFADHPPARTTIGVALQGGMKVEIEAVALVGAPAVPAVGH